MAPLLLPLSEELLVRIINFVDYPSVTPLALVSQTFNRLTTPQLYATVDFKGAYPDIGVTYLIAFTFDILQNPDLASSVRSFSIRGDFGYDERDSLSAAAEEEKSERGEK